MSDIFLSYAKEDRIFAVKLAHALESRGFSVWWDRHIPPGRSFDEVIEHEISIASSVVVLWSRTSVQSRWVKNEASLALERDMLHPALIDDVRPPLQFRDIESAVLIGWSPEISEPEFDHLVDVINKKLGRPDGSIPAAELGQKPPSARMAMSSAARESIYAPLKKRPFVFGAAILVLGSLLALWLLSKETLTERTGDNPTDAPHTTAPDTSSPSDRAERLDRDRLEPDSVKLGYYRLMSDVGELTDKKDYVEMAQLALEEGLPGEAQHVLETGIENGTLSGVDQIEQRQIDRLLSEARRESASDKASLPEIAESAEKAPQGQADIALGKAYLNYGQYDEAIGALRRGIRKGGVRDIDEAWITLGIAYTKIGQTESARRAFETVRRSSPWGNLAELWAARVSE